MNGSPGPEPAFSNTRGLSWVAIGIAIGIAVLHIATNSRYGFHRDELQVLSDALHPAAGYVVYPPLTPLLERLSLALFGLSLVGLRFFSVVAQAVIIVAAAMMARALGGSTRAQWIAALAVALGPVLLFEGSEFQYSSFEQCAWVLACYGAVRLLRDQQPRWWVWIGAFAGVGLMAKYTVSYFVVALVFSFLLTRSRRLLATRWFVLGCGVALLIVLPNLVWQARHGFVAITFLQHIHARDVRIGRGGAVAFWLFQLLACANVFAVPLWIAGLVSALRSERLRALGWMFLLTLLAFAASRARGYYTTAVFPVMIAVGAVVFDRWVSRFRAGPRRTLEIALVCALIVFGAIAAAMVLPLANAGRLRTFALAHSEDLREELGWDQLVGSVAQVWRQLPPDQRAHAAIFTGNYGETGAADVLGRAYGLPPAISLTNSAWLRGYPSPPPSTLVVVGFRPENVGEMFSGCRAAATVPYPEHLNNEEGNYFRHIFVCGPPLLPWPEFWAKYRRFG